MKHKLLGRGLSLLLLITLFLLPSLGVGAQSVVAPKLKALTVSFWPEYDRPEVLVIYRVQLSADTSLPAQVTFRLPGYIKDMHAVATEESSGLVSVNPDSIKLIHQGDDLLLTFPASSLNFHFEYYDPFILNKQKQTRQLTFDFSAPYDIELTTFEVQQPVEATDFSLVPEAVNTYTGYAGLQYSTVKVADLTPNDTFELSATYQRSSDELSVYSLTGQEGGQAGDVSVITEASSNGDLSPGYILVGIGVVLLLVSGGYYWWTKQNKAKNKLRSRVPKSQHKRAGRKKKEASGSKIDQSEHSHAADEQVYQFCHHCGADLQENSNFCHVCGTERRKG